MVERLKSAGPWAVVAFVFGLAWFAVVVLEVAAFHRVDASLAHGLNALLVNRAAGLDLSLIYLSESTGDVLGIVVLTLVMARILGREKGRKLNPGNVAALLIYLLLVAGLAYEVVEFLQMFVRRETPGSVLEGWQVPGALAAIEYSISSRASFPSVRVTVFTALAFVGFFRFGFAALWLLAIPVALGVAWTATGQVWPSDTLGGALFGWLVAAAVYLVRGNRLYAWLDRHLESLYTRQIGDRMKRWIGAGVRNKRRSSKLEEWDAQRSYTHWKSRAKKMTAELEPFVREHYGFSEVRFLGTPHKGKVFPASCDGRRVAIKLSRLTEKRRELLLNAIALVRKLSQSEEIAFPAILDTKQGEPIVPYGETYL